MWVQIWSNNPTERLNREIRRRTDSVGIFPLAMPSSASSARSWPSTPMWAEGRRYLDVLARCRLTLATNPVNEGDTETLPALTA